MNKSDRGWTKRWKELDQHERDYDRRLIIPEKFCRSPSLVSDDEAFLPTSLDFKDLHYWTITRLDVPEDILIDFQGIFRRFLEENGVRNSPDISFPELKKIFGGQKEKRR